MMGKSWQGKRTTETTQGAERKPDIHQLSNRCLSRTSRWGPHTQETLPPCLIPTEGRDRARQRQVRAGQGHEQNSQAQAEKLTLFASGEMPIQNHRGSWDGRVHSNPSIRKQRQGRHCKSDGSLVYELSSRPAGAP